MPIERLPLNFGCTFVVVCKLSRDESISRLPFQSPAASASLEKMLLRHVQEIHNDRIKFRFHTIAWVPATEKVSRTFQGLESKQELPWDLVDGIELVDTLHTPAVDPPS